MQLQLKNHASRLDDVQRKLIMIMENPYEELKVRLEEFESEKAAKKLRADVNELLNDRSDVPPKFSENFKVLR